MDAPDDLVIPIARSVGDTFPSLASYGGDGDMYDGLPSWGDGCRWGSRGGAMDEALLASDLVEVRVMRFLALGSVL